MSRSYSAGANDRAKPQFSNHTSSSGSTTPALTTPIALPRSRFNANIGTTSSASNSDADNEAADLMSFKSPEKPKNDILDMIQSLNANQRALVPVNNAMVPVNNAMGPLNNAMGPVLQGYNMQPQQQSAFTAAGALNAFNVPGATALPNRNMSMLTNQQLNSNVMTAPPIPSRNPVFMPNRISYIANQVYPGSSGATTPVAPTTPLGAMNPAGYSLSCTINSLNLKSNGNSDPTPFAYKPNIPLNIPLQSTTVHETATTPENNAAVEIQSAVSSAASRPPSSVSSVLSKAPSVKQRRTGRRSQDLIDFGSSPTRIPGQSGDVNSLLFDFDPLVNKTDETQSGRSSKTPTNGNDDSFSVKVKGVVVLSYEASEMLRYKGNSHARCDDEGSSYYEHVDPFEYMRPNGSSRSDQVVDAYDGLRSPIGVAGDTFDLPPPVPPRASTPDVSPEVESPTDAVAEEPAVRRVSGARKSVMVSSSLFNSILLFIQGKKIYILIFIY